jgi:hypothetical protein
MKLRASWSRILACGGALGLAAALLVGPGRPEASDPESGVRVAASVCEAQKLKRDKEWNPELQIEIPAQFDVPWPSLDACESAEAAWDDEAPGPRQPIPFSHAHHAGKFQIDCQYCHSGTESSQAAGVPSVELCMGCHAQFPPAYDEIEGIRILKQHWEEKRPIEWQQVYRVPEHVQFKHNRHLAAGFACQDCHGPVEKLDKLELNPDTKWWFYGLPTQTLEMGWCIKCHRENEASEDCLTCHY